MHLFLQQDIPLGWMDSLVVEFAWHVQGPGFDPNTARKQMSKTCFPAGDGAPEEGKGRRKGKREGEGRGKGKNGGRGRGRKKRGRKRKGNRKSPPVGHLRFHGGKMHRSQTNVSVVVRFLSYDKIKTGLNWCFVASQILSSEITPSSSSILPLAEQAPGSCFPVTMAPTVEKQHLQDPPSTLQEGWRRKDC